MVTSRFQISEVIYIFYISQFERKNINRALKDKHWINDIQVKLGILLETMCGHLYLNPMTRT